MRLFGCVLMAHTTSDRSHSRVIGEGSTALGVQAAGVCHTTRLARYPSSLTAGVRSCMSSLLLRLAMSHQAPGNYVPLTDTNNPWRNASGSTSSSSMGSAASAPGWLAPPSAQMLANSRMVVDIVKAWDARQSPSGLTGYRGFAPPRPKK